MEAVFYPVPRAPVILCKAAVLCFHSSGAFAARRGMSRDRPSAEDNVAADLGKLCQKPVNIRFFSCDLNYYLPGKPRLFRKKLRF